MCGIAGAVALGDTPLNQKYFKSMCDVIAHRGPDDAGYFVTQTSHNFISQSFTDQKFQSLHSDFLAIDQASGKHLLNAYPWNIFLGHRRLSIIDTSSAGHQPMADQDQSIWVSYNGEIYNFRELKKELKNLGFAFVTHSDTEVLIYAYKAWGIECIKRFNGMFAFALWDKAQNLFFLARDRYGIKPLYYTVLSNQQLVFASEVKAVLQYKDYQMAMDYEALLEYFTFQNIFTDKTLYQSIKILPAGHYISIDLKSPHPSLKFYQYWDFCFKQPEKIKEEREYLEELERLFTQAVTRQLISDVEIGAYLSGGMDSGSITAIAAKHFPYLKTFTVGFDLNNIAGLELGFDERAKSEYLSYLYKTEHYEMVLKSGDMERCLPEFSWFLEEPRVGQSYPNFYASKLAGKFVKVVLSGTGGDELFGGYPWRYYRAVVNDGFEDYIDKYYLFWQRLIDNRDLKKMFSPIWDKVSHVWTRDIFRDVFKQHRDKLNSCEDYINHSLYFETKTFLHGLLVVEDKLSMAHSLETRVPFLDNDLVDFAMQVPVRFKLGNLAQAVRINENTTGDKQQIYFEKMHDGKLILRKALEKFMPESYVKGPKQGFSSPDKSWFKGDSIEFVKAKLFNNKANIYRYFDREVVQHLVDQHLNGEQNRRLFIWSLLNINEWMS